MTLRIINNADYSCYINSSERRSSLPPLDHFLIIFVIINIIHLYYLFRCICNDKLTTMMQQNTLILMITENMYLVNGIYNFGHHRGRA